MLIEIAAGLLGTIVFLFIFWKRLKEDYSSEIVFKSSFNILLGILVGWGISFKFYPPGFLWLSFLGGVLGLAVSVLRFRVRAYETLEAFVIGVLPWTSFVFLADSVLNSSLISFIGFLVTLLVVFFSYYIDQHYKNFAWYKSGKIGFAGLATLALVFLIRSAIAISQTPVLSFVSFKIEAVVSGSLAFICFILIYNLGRIRQ